MKGRKTRHKNVWGTIRHSETIAECTAALNPDVVCTISRYRTRPQPMIYQYAEVGPILPPSLRRQTTADESPVDGRSYVTSTPDETARGPRGRRKMSNITDCGRKLSRFLLPKNKITSSFCIIYFNMKLRFHDQVLVFKFYWNRKMSFFIYCTLFAKFHPVLKIIITIDVH